MTPPPSSSLPSEFPSHWLWPVPPWRGYRPTVSSPWGTPRRRLDGTKRTHLGVDIMYRRQSRADQRVTFPPSTANGSADFFMPDDVAALAVDVGTVTSSEKGARGHAIVLRHAGGWRTFYQHLVTPRVKVGDQVLPGQVLGTIGGDPTQTPPLKHLHFEVWRGAGQEHAVDPEPAMTRQWRYAQAMPPTTSGDLVAMTYYSNNPDHDDDQDLSNAMAWGRPAGGAFGVITGNRGRPRKPRTEYQWVPGQDGERGYYDAGGGGGRRPPRPSPNPPPPIAQPPDYGGYPPQPPGYPPMPPGYPPPMQGYPPPMPPGYPPPMPGYPPPMMPGYPPPMMPGANDPYGQGYYGQPAYPGGVLYVDEYGNPVPPPQPGYGGVGWPGW